MTLAGKIVVGFLAVIIILAVLQMLWENYFRAKTEKLRYRLRQKIRKVKLKRALKRGNFKDALSVMEGLGKSAGSVLNQFKGQALLRDFASFAGRSKHGGIDAYKALAKNLDEETAGNIIHDTSANILFRIALMDVFSTETKFSEPELLEELTRTAAEKKDQTVIFELLKNKSGIASYDKAISAVLYDRTADETLRTSLMNEFSMKERFSAPELLVEFIRSSGDAGEKKKALDILTKKSHEVSDPRLLREIADIGDPMLTFKIMPKLTYPEFAPELRKIAASVKQYTMSLRETAFEKIPKTDEAFSERYCPFCGSTDIKNGYLGLDSDMFYYGCQCRSCGHKTAAPEGMGEAGDFTVSFGELFSKKY